MTICPNKLKHMFYNNITCKVKTINYETIYCIKMHLMNKKLTEVQPVCI